MKLKCEVCSEIIGEVVVESLANPVNGDMFASPDVPHGVPSPFFPEADWSQLKCPFGPHRAILLPNRILTDLGYVEITGDGPVAMGEQMDDAARSVRDRGKAEEAAERLAREQLGYETPKGETAMQRGDDGLATANLPLTVFPCPICQKEFKEERYLKAHQARMHAEAGNG